MRAGDEALENKIRRMIFNLIVEYPGVSSNTIKNVFELTESALRYHLNYLEKNNKISSSDERGIKCYFPHPISVSIPKNTKDISKSNKLTPNQELLLTTIIRYPGITQKDLVSRTRISRFKANRNLKILKDLNLIKNTRNQNTICYEYVPDDDMRLKILRSFIVKFLNNEIDERTFLRLLKRVSE